MIKIRHIPSNHFPLNDGGMFYSMIGDLIDNSYFIPKIISYNQAGIPFTYPPFSFYSAAVLEKFAGISRIDLIMFIPGIVSIATTLVIYKLALKISKSDFAAFTAAGIHAVWPAAYTWIIMGGGLSRSFGQFFALCAIFYCIEYVSNNKRISILKYGVFLSLTILSHPEWTSFAAYTSFLIIFLGIRKPNVILAFVAQTALIVFLSTSVWWIQIVINNNFHSLINAVHAGRSDSINFGILFSNHIEIIIFLMIILTAPRRKAKYLFRKEEVFLFTWIIIGIFLRLRSSTTHLVIPLSLLTGHFLNEIRLKLNTHIQNYPGEAGRHGAKILAIALTVIMLAYIFISSQNFPERLNSLSNDNIDAMSWIEKNTGSSAMFVIMNEEDRWWLDKTSEWFPAITKRKNVILVQGYEWLPHSIYINQGNGFYMAKSCFWEGIDCLEDRFGELAISFDHIYLEENTTGLNSQFADSLSNSKRYQKIYEKNYISIWKSITSPPSAVLPPL